MLEQEIERVNRKQILDLQYNPTGKAVSVSSEIMQCFQGSFDNKALLGIEKNFLSVVITIELEISELEKLLEQSRRYSHKDVHAVKTKEKNSCYNHKI